MKLQIVAAIVDTRQLTLYKADGETIVIPQGDSKLRLILDQVTPQIIAKGYAELDMTSMQGTAGYQDFEKKSGFVRFFKVAREKLAGLFAPHVDQAAVGKVPQTHIETAIETNQAVIDEILAHAQPVSSPSFDTTNLRKQGNIAEEGGHTDKQNYEPQTSHTIVAQVGNKLIPDMERIDSHLARAAKLGSTKGVERFLERLAAVMDERSHSVEDLLKFMERSDMPIADDGSVIIYKVLKRKGDHYVDCHSGNVPQKVGSFVCMDISLVDRHRNNECSNGLHVARRGYISGFSGNVCVIAKLAPEDVVTVPTYDANKMRVMGYHILHELSQDMHNKLKQNKPITELDEGKVLLGQIIAGQHIGRLEEVRITGQMGSGIVVTPITPKATPASNILAGVTIASAPAEALDNPSGAKSDKPINPKDVVKTVAGLSRKEQAQKIFKAYQENPSQENKDRLVAFKKSVKLGWKVLGIDESELQ